MLNAFTKISFLLLGLSIVASCTKKIVEPNSSSLPAESSKRTEVQLLKDSIYHYYKLYSLWERSITVYEKISDFTDRFQSSYEVLNSLKSMTPEFTPYFMYGGTYDRFSYFSEMDGYNANSSKLLMDKNEGTGLSFALGAINSSVAYPVVNMVEGGSSAHTAGVKRGDIILAIDDEDMTIKVECSGGSCRVADAKKLDSVQLAISKIDRLGAVGLTVQKAGGKVKSYQLSNHAYDIDPLILDTVYKYSNKNIGYFAYSSFEKLEKNNSNQRKIDEMFDEFERENIKALIVDLRYNVGGYVDAATYIADKIINTAGKNKLMLTYEVNSYLEKSKSRYNSTFRDVNFKKTSDLELEKVCFIVSKNTASAAEMLINVLKPYMDVKLIAEEQYTYGKPVGYFAQPILGKINLWVTSFKLLNANKESDYWTGMKGDLTNVKDYIFLDFGVREEDMLRAALDLTGIEQFRSGARVSDSRGLIKMKNMSTQIIKGALKTH